MKFYSDLDDILPASSGDGVDDQFGAGLRWRFRLHQAPVELYAGGQYPYRDDLRILARGQSLPRAVHHHQTGGRRGGPGSPGLVGHSRFTMGLSGQGRWPFATPFHAVCSPGADVGGRHPGHPEGRSLIEAHRGR